MNEECGGRAREKDGKRFPSDRTQFKSEHFSKKMMRASIIYRKRHGNEGVRFFVSKDLL